MALEFLYRQPVCRKHRGRFLQIIQSCRIIRVFCRLQLIIYEISVLHVGDLF